MATSAVAIRNPVYGEDESDVLISKATWTLKLSGLVFAGLLVIGRSASYGNVTWTPAYHAASTPLIVQLAGSQKPAPVVPSFGSIDGLMNKASTANEVIAFHPGNSGDGGEGNGSGASSMHGPNDHDSDAQGGGIPRRVAAPAVSTAQARSTRHRPPRRLRVAATAAPTARRRSPRRRPP